MGKPYSLDLRKRVIESLKEGRGATETALIFKISRDSVERWEKLEKENRLEALDNKKRKPKKLDGEKLKVYIKKNPDKTLSEIGAKFGASAVAVFNRVKSLGISYKKKR